jgi:hypothetical protein
VYCGGGGGGGCGCGCGCGGGCGCWSRLMLALALVLVLVLEVKCWWLSPCGCALPSMPIAAAEAFASSARRIGSVGVGVGTITACDRSGMRRPVSTMESDQSIGELRPVRDTVWHR